MLDWINIGSNALSEEPAHQVRPAEYILWTAPGQ